MNLQSFATTSFPLFLTYDQVSWKYSKWLLRKCPKTSQKVHENWPPSCQIFSSWLLGLGGSGIPGYFQVIFHSNWQDADPHKVSRGSRARAPESFCLWDYWGSQKYDIGAVFAAQSTKFQVISRFPRFSRSWFKFQVISRFPRVLGTMLKGNLS